MNIKKVGKALISFMVAGTILLNTSSMYVKATGEIENGENQTNATGSNKIKLGITLFRPNSEPRQITNSNNLVATAGKNGKEDFIAYQADYSSSEKLRVWKIVQQEDEEEINYDKAIYCLKAEQGFGNADDWANDNFSTTTGTQYNQKYNMYNNSDKEAIKTAMGLTGEDTDTTYNKILWLINNMYVKGDNMQTYLSQVKHKDEQGNVETDDNGNEITLWDVMKKNRQYTGYTEEESEEINKLDDLTENDIEVIQQMAIWYFTNSENPKYHLEDFTTLNLGFKTGEQEDTVAFDTIAQLYRKEINNTTYEFGQARADYAKELYKYLITEANNH